MTDLAPVAPAPTTTVAPEAKVSNSKDAPKDQTGNPKDGAIDKPTQAEIEKYKIKVRGKEKEVEFNRNDPRSITKMLEKYYGADEVFEEASQKTRNAERIIEMLRTDPEKVLSDPRIGVDLIKFCEKVLWERMQEESLTPDQKRQRDIERELQKYKDSEAKTKAEAEEKERAALQAHYEGDFEKKILGALEQGGVPKTKGTVRRMAQYMRMAVENNLDIEPKDLIARVRQDYIDEHREMYQSAEGDALISLVGEDFAKKIRETDLKRLKSTQTSQFQTPAPKSQPSTPTTRVRKLTGQDWRREIMEEQGLVKRRQ